MSISLSILQSRSNISQSKVALKVCEVVPPELAASLHVVYFPQLGKDEPWSDGRGCTDLILGFLICIPLREEWETEENFPQVEGWTYQFSSEYVVFSQECCYSLTCACLVRAYTSKNRICMVRRFQPRFRT